MLQRYGMILATLGALFVIMQARRGELTTARYAQGLGIGLAQRELGIRLGMAAKLEGHLQQMGHPPRGRIIQRSCQLLGAHGLQS
jgi:hypothetical protein